MKKKDFINLYYERGEFATKIDAEKKAAAFLEVLEEILLKGDDISFVGFGKFMTFNKMPRAYYNPQTKAKLEASAKKFIRFRPSPGLMKKLNYN